MVKRIDFKFVQMKGQIISQRHMNANSNENALTTFNKSALKPLDKLQPNSSVMGVLVRSDEGPHISKGDTCNKDIVKIH